VDQVSRAAHAKFVDEREPHGKHEMIGCARSWVGWVGRRA
jgi:hypothetical protein